MDRFRKLIAALLIVGTLVQDGAGCGPTGAGDGTAGGGGGTHKKDEVNRREPIEIVRLIVGSTSYGINMRLRVWDKKGNRHEWPEGGGMEFKHMTGKPFEAKIEYNPGITFNMEIAVYADRDKPFEMETGEAISCKIQNIHGRNLITPQEMRLRDNMHSAEVYCKHTIFGTE